MKFLRVILVACAFLFLIGSIVLLRYGWGNGNLIFFIWGIEAVILIIGIVFERSSYKTKNTSEKGWVQTKERFIDHKSGKLVEVHFHPKTGERKYVEVSSSGL